MPDPKDRENQERERKVELSEFEKRYVDIDQTQPETVEVNPGGEGEDGPPVASFVQDED